MDSIYGYLLVLLFTVLQLGESIAVKTYAKRYSSGGMLMNAIISLFACAFFVVNDLLFTDGFNFPLAMIPYALINVVLYASGFYFAFLAFKVGPYGLTRLISNFSLMFGIFYGIVILNEPTTPFTYIGIAMIVAAMFLMNYVGKSQTVTAKESGISFKWLIYMIITVVSNGFIAILNRMQQIKFDRACDNEFMMISTGGAFLILFIIGLIIDHARLGEVLKHGTLYGAASGLFNGAKNFTMLLVYIFIPISTAGPMKTGLGLVAAFLVSIFFYKEKYATTQKIGVLLGTVAVVLLAL